LEGITLEEIEQRLEEEAAADLTDEESASLNRGGPLYRIRVRSKVEDGTFHAMEALVNIQQTANPPVAILWRRYALAAQSEYPDAHRETLAE